MKIRSIEPYGAPEGDVCLVLDTQVAYPPFPRLIDNGVVVDCKAAIPEDRRVVFIESPASHVLEISQSASPIRGDRTVEYWIRRGERHKLEELFEEIAALSITGLNVSDQWLEFQLGPSVEGDRSSLDFLRGFLSATEFISGKQPPSDSNTVPLVAQPPSQETLRAQLIAKLIPLAKPLKPYLPTRLVVVLYKILRKLR